MQEKIKNLINEALKNLGIEDVDFVVEHPADLKMGDYSTNIAMVLTKKLQMNPRELAEKIVAEMSKSLFNIVDKIEVAGPGFINFYLSPKFFNNSIKEILENKNFGENQSLVEKKIFIEHTQPNPFKTFHIGHLMNNAIGESVVRIVKANGADVKVASYHGDVGLHVAKTIYGMMQDKPQEFMLQKDDIVLSQQMAFLGYCYAFGTDRYESLNIEGKNKVIDINKKIYERSDKEINYLYNLGKDISLRYFDSIYNRLDSHFDYHFYESEAGPIGKNIVLENLGRVFEESEGATIFKGENFKPKTHTRVFLNKDKLPTYEAKEIGLAKIKKDLFTYDKSITITADEQDAFFNVLEVAIGEVFPEVKGKLKHLSHGMLKLPSGKMSSRTGSIISAEDLIDQVKEKVKGDEKIAIGAIKYMILRQAIGGDIIFDFDKSVSTEGDSGVYFQYSCVRAKSVLEKAEGLGMYTSFQIPTGWESTLIEKLLYQFPEVVLRSGQELQPHYVTNYLTELAQAFNSFYGNTVIINDKDESSAYKLSITKAFFVIMKKGLNLLGIEAPERM